MFSTVFFYSLPIADVFIGVHQYHFFLVWSVEYNISWWVVDQQMSVFQTMLTNVSLQNVAVTKWGFGYTNMSKIEQKSVTTSEIDKCPQIVFWKMSTTNCISNNDYAKLKERQKGKQAGKTLWRNMFFSDSGKITREMTTEEAFLEPTLWNYLPLLLEMLSREAFL